MQDGKTARDCAQEKSNFDREGDKKRKTEVVAWLDAVKAAVKATGGYTKWQQLIPQQQEELAQKQQMNKNLLKAAEKGDSDEVKRLVEGGE